MKKFKIEFLHIDGDTREVIIEAYDIEKAKLRFEVNWGLEMKIKNIKLIEEDEKKIVAIDGKAYTKDQLVRMNFLFIGGQWHGSIAKTINGIEIKNLSMTEVLNIGRNNKSSK